MNSKQLKQGLIPAVIVCLLTLITLTTATYAWFTASNRQIFTSKVTAKTSESDVSLLLSGNDDFSAKKSEAAIVQLNSTSAEKLLPVSTDDLVHFVTGNAIDEKNADTFLPVENEANYYHGRIYLKAEASPDMGDGQMKLYWNNGTGGGTPMSNMDGGLASAARLGLVFRGEELNQSRILSLSSAGVQGAGMNTTVNGVEQSGAIVLHSGADGAVSAVADPSRLWLDFAVHDGRPLPEVPLCTVQLNKVYTLDIYFYLEGCDPDCVNEIAKNDADLTLWLYGQLVTGG